MNHNLICRAFFRDFILEWKWWIATVAKNNNIMSEITDVCANISSHNGNDVTLQTILDRTQHTHIVHQGFP